MTNVVKFAPESLTSRRKPARKLRASERNIKFAWMLPFLNETVTKFGEVISSNGQDARVAKIGHFTILKWNREGDEVNPPEICIDVFFSGIVRGKVMSVCLRNFDSGKYAGCQFHISSWKRGDWENVLINLCKAKLDGR